MLSDVELPVSQFEVEFQFPHMHNSLNPSRSYPQDPPVDSQALQKESLFTCTEYLTRIPYDH